ncbi:MAG: TrkA family potassium uptake protein [Desulfobacterales bacterium]|nr:TrkA family potassium uptake protein [Desulfobacterales bacterium]
MKQVAVIGLGRFGSSVARTLADSGCEVLAVDADESRVKAIADEVTDAVRANALDEEALRALGLRNFEVVVVAIGHEVQASILTTVLLKEMGIPKIVAKAQDDLHGRVLQKVGADVVVYPERDMGVRLAHTLISRNVIDEIQLSTDYSILEMAAPHGFLGRNLKDLEAPPTVWTQRAGDPTQGSNHRLPERRTACGGGDILVVLGQPDKLAPLGE